MEWRKRSLNETMGNMVIHPNNRRMFLYGLLPAIVLLCTAFFLRTTFLKSDYKERMLLRSGVIDSETKPTSSFVCQTGVLPLLTKNSPNQVAYHFLTCYEEARGRRPFEEVGELCPETARRSPDLSGLGA
ncbi:hypothetical protein ZOSMA_56G00790 [Zostera marina]|uniref:Uncharacterized protein n=1 Tax=Zostera marina TaxID=29655 RepID=A0A0K9NW23_ZOSMR|nr:hypothetical protein ZOSMA_56G00790 [Zostera marina]